MDSKKISYKNVAKSFIIYPKDSGIYCDERTEIDIHNASPAPFVVIEQPNSVEDGFLKINSIEQWEVIDKTVRSALETIKEKKDKQ